MINPEVFIEKQWKRPLRITAEQMYAKLGTIAYRVGFAQRYPQNPVFIIGSPRSGTSIFSSMISVNPNIANFSEAIYVWEPKDRLYSNDHLKTASDVTPSDIARIRGAFGFYQRIMGKSCFVNKNPRSSVRIGFIHAIFPEAHFIHIVRDGRAVVNSILEIINREKFRQKIPMGGFCKPRNWQKLLEMSPLERHATQWTEIMKEIQKSKLLVPKEQWIEIKYEELCTDPCHHLEEIYKHIGVKVNGETLKYISNMAKSQNYKWLEKYSLKERNHMEKIMNDGLKLYNYI